VEVVASLSQGRTAAAQCGLFTHKSVPVIFEPPCIYTIMPAISSDDCDYDDGDDDDDDDDDNDDDDDDDHDDVLQETQQRL